MAPVKPLRFSVMLTWPAGPALMCTLPVEWTNRSITRWSTLKTVVPGAGWRGNVLAGGLVAMMSRMAASSAALTSTNRRGRRHAGGTWACTHAARELDDALPRTVSMAAEPAASMRRKGGLWGSWLAFCRAPLVTSLRDLSGPPSSAFIPSVFPAGGDSYVWRGQFAVPQGAKQRLAGRYPVHAAAGVPNPDATVSTGTDFEGIATWCQHPGKLAARPGSVARRNAGKPPC